MRNLKCLVFFAWAAVMILFAFSSCVEPENWVTGMNIESMRKFADSASKLNDDENSIHAFAKASALLNDADTLLRHGSKLESKSYLYSASSYIAYGLCHRKDQCLAGKIGVADTLHPLSIMMETGSNQWLVTMQEEQALDGWLRYCCILNPEKTDFFADLQKQKRENRINIEKAITDKSSACRLLSRENMEYGAEIYASLVESLTSLYAPQYLDSTMSSLQTIKLHMDSLPSNPWTLLAMGDSLYNSKFDIASLVPVEIFTCAVNLINPVERPQDVVEEVIEN